MIDLKFIHKSACLWLKKWRTLCKCFNNYYLSLWTVSLGFVLHFPSFSSTHLCHLPASSNFHVILSSNRHLSAYVSNKHWNSMGMVWSGLDWFCCSKFTICVWLFVNHVRVGHSFFAHLQTSRFLSTSRLCVVAQNTIYNFNVIFVGFFSLSSTSSYNCVCRHFFSFSFFLGCTSLEAILKHPVEKFWTDVPNVTSRLPKMKRFFQYVLTEQSICHLEFRLC